MNHPWAVCQEENIRRLEREVQVLKKKLAAEKRKCSRIAKRSTTDELTRLPNRAAYKAAKRRESARQKRNGLPLAIAVLDLDYFKQVNDRYGHAVGDKVLKRFAKVLKTKMRETDFVARLGGEEFVMIMPNTTAELSLVVIDRIRAAVEMCSVRVAGKTVRFTVSVGVATQTLGGDPDDTFERADKALYVAKKNGRNRVEQAR